MQRPNQALFFFFFFFFFGGGGGGGGGVALGGSHARQKKWQAKTSNRNGLKMRKIRIFEHISLDGVIAPGGRTKTATTRMADGRHRIEPRPGQRPSPRHRARASICCLAAAPTISGPATGRRPGGPIADGLNAATKYVATHRPESLGWGPVGTWARTSWRAFAASSQRTAPT